MNRPYIICHMLTTLDWKISGPALGTPEAAALAGHYQKLHRLFHADATVYGNATIAEVFTKGRQPDLAPFQGTILSREDYIADPEADQYLISVDPDGGIGWTGPVVQGHGNTTGGCIRQLLGLPTEGRNLLSVWRKACDLLLGCLCQAARAFRH